MLHLVRVLSLIGSGISFYLLTMSLSGAVDSIAGCGNASGCSEVLGSRWSQIFGIPVSSLSLLTYCLTLVASFGRSKFALVTSAIILVCAAIWFTGLQLFVIEGFCPWCMAIHLVGMATASGIFLHSRPLEKRMLATATAVSMLPFVFFVFGQVFGPTPDTHLVSEIKITFPPEDTSVPIHCRGEGQKVDYDGKQFCVDSLPHIGPSDAPYVLVEYYDYCCKACAVMEGELVELQDKHPGKFAIILLPVPMNRMCNEHLPSNIADHGYACEYAKLALAAWRAKPEVFPQVHERLFRRPIIHHSVIKKDIEAILDPVKLDPYLEDPWIDELLAANADDFQLLIEETVKMPKIRIKGNQVLSGVVDDTQEFLKLIEDSVAPGT